MNGSRGMIRAIIVLLGLLAFVPPGQARVVESFRLGGWNGDAFVNDDTGLFNSCVAIARYRSGISMSVEVDSRYNWWIGFSSPGWTMTTGEKIALQYRIDRGAWQSGVATAISPQLARMAMPADGYIIRRFRRGRVLYVSDGGNSYQFKLTGTSKLLARLARCVEKNVARHGAGPGLSRDDGGAAKQPVVQAPEAPKTSKPDDTQLQIEATQTLFNLMARAGLTDLKLIAKADRREELKEVHAVAGSQDMALAAHIYPQDSFVSDNQLMANLISDAATDCGGDFAAGYRRKTIGGREVFAGQSECAAGDVEIIERYAISARKNGGVFVFAVIDTMVGEGGGEASAAAEELTEDAFHRAALQATE